MAPPGQEPRQGEERPQLLLARRDPGDRLRPLRVQRPQKRRRHAREDDAHLAGETRRKRGEEPEEKHRVHRVEQDVHDMVRLPAWAEERYVGHVRDRGERHPYPAVPQSAEGGALIFPILNFGF